MTSREDIINEIKSEKVKIDETFRMYEKQELAILQRKLEDILEDYRLYNRNTEQIIKENIKSIGVIISSNRDIFLAAVEQNIQSLNRKLEGEEVKLNEQINKLEEIANQVRKNLDAHIDHTQIAYELITRLGIRENEEVRYMVNKTVTEKIVKLKDELFSDITKTIARTCEFNAIFQNIEKYNEFENTPELIVIQTSTGEEYTVEKLGENLKLRKWKPRDSFEAKKVLYGEEADEIYNQLKAQIEEALEVILITTSDGKKYTFEKLGNLIKQREYKLADEFKADTRVEGPEADTLYNELKIQLEEALKTQEQNNVVSENRRAFK